MSNPAYGPLYYSPMNRQLYYDEIQRHFGSAQGGFTPDNPFRMGGGMGGGGGAYRPPSAGVSQNWREEMLSYNPKWSESKILNNVGDVARRVGNLAGNLVGTGGGGGGGTAPSAAGANPPVTAPATSRGMRRSRNTPTTV